MSLTSFHTEVVKHLESIQYKDISSFLQTISDQENVSVIMPNGQLIQGYDRVKALNNDWFGDTDWILSYNIIKEETTDTMGYAVVEVDYRDVDPEGNPYSTIYYLTLIFRKISGKWLLVHDQNTFTNV